MIHKAKSHDPKAFTELMRLQMPNMYRTAAAILLNDEDAADAVQETILICWEKVGQLKEEKFFKTWMTRILINECFRIIRNKEKVEYMDEMEERCADSIVDPECNLEWKEAMAAVDEKYRLVLILYYAQGFTGKEIAKILKIPHATVRTRLSRGREQLKKYYQMS